MSVFGRLAWGICFMGMTGLGFGEGAAAERYPIRAELTLEGYLQRVVRYNEAVQARVLGFHAVRRQRQAELGAFEPAFVAGGEWVDRQSPNTIALERQFQSGGFYVERSKRYTSAVELLTPLGTRLRIGATGKETVNNIVRGILDPDVEHEVSYGISLEQPLLKGAGLAANLASLRLAARQSDIAFQEYRRELMQVVAQAELAYWQLHYAQEELELSRESVAVAQTLLNDSRASFQAGRGARLDVLEAEAGLAIRQARASVSHQRRIDALNQLAAFFGASPREQLADYIAVDVPVSRPVDISFQESLEAALALNPDLLRAQAAVEQERIRMGYARNLWLPELNLSASFGASGLGYNWRTAWDDIENADFPAWSAGLVVRLPLWGDVRGRNDWRAARLRLLQARRFEASLMTQLRAGCDSTEQRVATAYTSARSLEAVVDFRVNLLETRLQSRDLGRMDARSVLEAEQELFVARLEQLQSEVEYQRALLELQILSGNLLQLRGLDLSFEELEEKTRHWTRQPGRPLPPVLEYAQPDFVRLPAGPAPTLAQDRPAAPWFGLDWGQSRAGPEPAISSYHEQDPTDGAVAPRRVSRPGAGPRGR